MVACVDASVVLRHIFAADVSIRRALDYPAVMSSELMEIECRRVPLCCRLQDDLTHEGFVEAVRRLDSVLDGIDLVELSPAIKRRAMESCPVLVKTLDALHLSLVLVQQRNRPDQRQVLHVVPPRPRPVVADAAVSETRVAEPRASEPKAVEPAK